MKKTYSFISFFVIIAMLLVGCNLGGGENTTPQESTTTTPAPVCEKHVDENKDNLCDKCGGEFKEDPVPVELAETTMYLVGDSTVASFSDSYFYPRYGYGTQIGNYFSEKVTVKNLALSGRSSKSFLSEANYTTLKNSLKEGDILVIGFGHNDEKSDDVARFTDASLPYTDENSFGYHLYEYYIKLAQEKGATPILCTPIVRAQSTDNYTGSEGHVTANGDYAAAIREVGEAYGVDIIDLTVLTRSRYEEIGFEEACYYHAVINGKYDADGTTIIPDFATVDKTHLNIYGAKYVAYLLAKEMSELSVIGGYVLPDIKEPTKADLVANPNYEVSDYTSPNLGNYNPHAHFSTVTNGWYGTAFGNTGGSPQSTSNGYIAKEVSEGVFQVGQHLDSGSNKGKFQSADDGFAFAFRQVDANTNFKLTVSGKIVYTAGVKQAGFGLMLRDDCIIGQAATGTISSNFVTAGIYFPSDNAMNANFYRENSTLNKGKSVAGNLAVGDTFTMSIERVGQSVTVTVIYGDQTYENVFVDFDFFSVDTQYMYVGMFANRGTVVEFTDIVFTVTGESQGA
jgi:lysophospholipase L1-like esterase